MKYLKYVPYLIIAIFAITLVAGMGTRTERTETLIKFDFKLRIKYLESEPVILGHEVLNVVKHEVFETKKLTGEVVDYGCWLTFAGKDFGSASMNDTKLNYQARDIAQKANATLAGFGDLFHFDYDTATVWATDCTETEGFVDVELWNTYGQRNGGFLTYTKDEGHETAWIHLPVAFYDSVLKSAVENTTFDPKTVAYPSIVEIGGYRVLPDDPNGLGFWLANQSTFLQLVYGRETQITFAPAKYDYTVTTNSTRFTGSGCNDRNYANYGSCSDWGPSYETTSDTNSYEIDVVIGSMTLK